MALDPALIADTRSWLIKAANDLRGAEIDLTAEPPLLEDAVFHLKLNHELIIHRYRTRISSPPCCSAYPVSST